jgi:trans-2-enoyl-CoA reductase
LAKEWQINTINVVRNRPNLEELKSRLSSLGANHVVTEEELRQKEIMYKVFKNVPNPKLALNCVGGKNATDCMRYLSFRGVMVTYGGMSKQPLTIPTGSLIFKDHRFYGYWMTRWNQENATNEERYQMLKYLCTLIKDKKLETPKTIEVSFDDYKEALQKCMQGFADAKYLFVMK